MNDADLLHAALMGAPAEPYLRTNEHAILDYQGLPAIARGFLAMNMGNASETMAIEEAGFMPRLYADHEGRRCRVVMVSSLGDVGIAYRDVDAGYAQRLSIYDLDNFALTWEGVPKLPMSLPEYANHYREVHLGKRAKRRAAARARNA